MAAAECNDSGRFRAGRNRAGALVLAACSRRRGGGGDEASRRRTSRSERLHLWRERWFARLIGLSFATGALLAASAAYLAGRANAPEAAPPSSEGPTPAGLNDTYVTPALSALWAFVPPPAVVRLSPKSDGPGQDTAAPILPTLSVEGLSLAGVRAMPGGQGQMLCLIYARPDAANIALCVEKAGDPGDSVPRVSGSFPSSMIAWRQKGANYALTGALPEPELAPWRTRRARKSRPSTGGRSPRKPTGRGGFPARGQSSQNVARRSRARNRAHRAALRSLPGRRRASLFRAISR